MDVRGDEIGHHTGRRPPAKRPKSKPQKVEFYAYTHAGPDGDVFYVGKGQGRRGHLMTGRMPWHQSRIDAIGRQNVVVTLYPAQTENGARVIEREMIARLTAEGAPLCNKEGRLSRAEQRGGRPFVAHLSEDRWAKLKALGTAWLERAIDQAEDARG
jgi:hypothetical protein